MSILFRRFAFLLALLLILPITACGTGNTVRLIYNPAGETVLPQPGAPQLTVVLFEDQRGQVPIGVRRDGTSIASSSLVADWVGRSLSDELTRLGPQVSYSSTMAHAKSANPQYIVSGIVREVWLKEINPTTMSATVRVEVTLTSKKGVVYTETLSSSQERQGLLTSSAAENLLADTLRDTLAPSAKKIYAALR